MHRLKIFLATEAGLNILVSKEHFYKDSFHSNLNTSKNKPDTTIDLQKTGQKWSTENVSEKSSSLIQYEIFPIFFLVTDKISLLKKVSS